MWISASAICFTAVKKIRRLTAEHAESAENPKVLFSAVFAVSAVIVDFSTHFQRLTATICNSTRAPAFSAAT